jgi:hypothetical protein
VKEREELLDTVLPAYVVSCRPLHLVSACIGVPVRHQRFVDLSVKQPLAVCVLRFLIVCASST